MGNVKTYAVGNGEITLSVRDADELRCILQKELLENVVRGIIEDNEEAFHFTSEKSRSRFINEIVDGFDDLTNIYGAYEEQVSDFIFEHADEIGVSV